MGGGKQSQRVGHSSLLVTGCHYTDRYLPFHNQRQWLGDGIAQSVQVLATSWMAGIFMNNNDDKEQVILVTDFKRGDK
jgi:hypothetical protein